MNPIQQRLTAVRSRQQWLRVAQCGGWGTLISGVSGCIVGLLMQLQVLTPSWIHILGILFVGPVLGASIAFMAPTPLRKAARAIDQTYSLKDRTVTAWSFQNLPDRSSLQSLQVKDAEDHLKQVNPAVVAPFQFPRPLAGGLFCTLVALGLVFLVPRPDAVIAAPVNHPVVSTQAEKLKEELKKLEEFNQQEVDEEIEQLLKELAQKVRELSEPGIVPEEALAKLSEMQSALEARQAQLNDPAVMAELQDIGKALSLAESMQAAGGALSSGDLEKAAQELEKLTELPQMNQQTERAVTEQLQKTTANSSKGASRQIREAAKQMSEGLSQGNKSRFSEGAQGLAGEVKKQSRKRKLSDLLRKQCQCLSECKGECESECQNQSESKKKGGQKAGTARSGNQPGEKTPQLRTNQNLQLQGQESESGDVETETSDAPETPQTASREYREKLQKYEQLSESVLENEPIPLGHRQTIRRYFEMIRPQNNEVDTVNQKLESR